ncbi:SGNH/GDSL hydrolase family protein [Gammaproteobacteria bacterium]|nr:SGNH/GDSL hydrolase family protein [Gammaproteobacteria bacterium]
MLRAFRIVGGCIVFVTIIILGLEAGLRAFPQELIPLTYLKRFQKDVRLEIAQRLMLRNESQMRVIERDDGGPTLKLYKPNTMVHHDFKAKNEKGDTLLDAQGFCNPPRDRYDLPTIDLIVLGDSFTACMVSQPEATWASQLGMLTGKSVYNLGKGGVGPYEYLQIFRYFGLPKQPDVVVMNIYEGNDLRDSIRYHEHVAAGREGHILYRQAGDRYQPELDYDGLLDNPIGRNSYALNLVLAVIGKQTHKVILWATGDEQTDREKVNFRYQLQFPDNVMKFNLQNADESEVRFAKKLRAGEVELSAFDDALERFVAMSSEHGFKPIVAYAPSAHIAYADYVQFEDPALSELMPWFSQMQREFFRDAADRIGFRFVDLTSAMQVAGRELQDRELLYFPVNLHFTRKGHEVYAQALANALSGVD